MLLLVELSAYLTARHKPQPNEKDEREKTGFNYTEGVGKFQPRVELWQPWIELKGFVFRCDSTRLGEPFQGCMKTEALVIPGFKVNP